MEDGLRVLGLRQQFAGPRVLEMQLHERRDVADADGNQEDGNGDARGERKVAQNERNTGGLFVHGGHSEECEVGIGRVATQAGGIFWWYDLIVGEPMRS